MHHAVFSTNGRGTISRKMENHALTRRAADLNDRVLKQNDYRDTTCVLRTVCEYKPLSHPHHCCQITSNLGSALVRRGRLERRLENGESVDPVKTATRMPCCVFWLVKRFLQWSVTRPSDDCASGSPRLLRSVESMLEVRRALGRGGGRSAGGSERPWLRRSASQCWRFGEHWVVAVVGRQEVRRGRLERRLEHGESVDPVKTATCMPCCVVWLVKRFLQWSVTRPRADCALRSGL